MRTTKPRCTQSVCMHSTCGHQSYLVHVETADHQIDLWDSPSQYPLPWVTVSLWQRSPLVTGCLSVTAEGNAQSPTQEFPKVTRKWFASCIKREYCSMSIVY